MIRIVSEKDLPKMKEACRIVCETLLLAKTLIRVGITTEEIDTACEKFIRSQGAVPSFKGYEGFPSTCCMSLNDCIVHGRPSQYKLKEGDIVSIDVGACYMGFHGDAARTFIVGEGSETAKKLVDTTRECFFEAIKILKAGTTLKEVGIAVQTHAERNGFSVVREMCGHGIGSHLHENPNILNYDGYAGNGGRFVAGQTVAIEPMINEGTWEGYNDGREDIPSYKTKDGKLSAHYENTVLVLKDGCEVLTEIL